MINQYLPEPFVEALGWTLLHSLWQIALFALLAVVALIFMRGFTAQSRYRMLGGALAICVLVVAATFWQIFQDATVNYAAGEATSQVRKVRTLRTAETDSPNLDLTTEIAANDYESAAYEESSVETFGDRTAGYFDRHLPLIVTLWLLGVFLLLLRMLGQLAYVQRLKSYGIENFPDSWNETLRELENKLDIRRKVRYVSSRLIDGPMTLGWLTPMVLFPVELMTGLEREEIRSILAHELAHVKRNDYLFNLLQSLVGILFFYHPGAWWLSNRLSEEREHCCDDLAIELGANPKYYARTIIHLKENQMKNVALAQNSTGAKSKKNSNAFAFRIMRLFDAPVRIATYREGFLSAILLVGGLFAGVKAAQISSDPVTDNTIDYFQDRIGGSIDDIAPPPPPPPPAPFSEGDNQREVNTSPDVQRESEPLVRQEQNSQPRVVVNQDRLHRFFAAIDDNDFVLVREMIAKGIDLNAEDEKGRFPLYIAANEDLTEMARLLIEKGAKVNYLNKRGWTALIECADEGSLNTAKLLIEKGADVNLRGQNAPTALVMASSENHVDVLALLLENAAESRDEYGVVHVAAEEGSMEVLQYLADAGYLLNARNGKGRSPLSYAAEEGHLEVVRFLVEKGVAVDKQDFEGRTALAYAAEEDNESVARYLLMNSPDRFKQTQDGKALLAAAEEGNTKMVRILLNAGFDPNYSTENGYTPLMAAAREESSSTVNVLLDKGANVNASTKSGYTALFAAAGENDFATLKSLLTAGAKLEARADIHYQTLASDHAFAAEISKATPLFEAIREKCKVCVEELIEAGAKVNVKASFGYVELLGSFYARNKPLDYDDIDLDAAFAEDSKDAKVIFKEGGWTPLMQAAFEGDSIVAATLLVAGADKNARTTNGLTALDVARTMKQNSVIRLLK